MSKKERKPLSESGSGTVYENLDDLKKELQEEAPEEAPESAESGAGPEAGQGRGNTSDAEQGEQGRPRSGETVRMTFHIDAELAERLRNAVYWTPAGVTLSGTARDALWDALEEIERRYNEGEPFPERDEDLKGGRPTS